MCASNVEIELSLCCINGTLNCVSVNCFVAVFLTKRCFSVLCDNILILKIVYPRFLREEQIIFIWKKLISQSLLHWPRSIGLFFSNSAIFWHLKKIIRCLATLFLQSYSRFVSWKPKRCIVFAVCCFRGVLFSRCNSVFFRFRNWGFFCDFAERTLSYLLTHFDSFDLVFLNKKWPLHA